MQSEIPEPSFPGVQQVISLAHSWEQSKKQYAHPGGESIGVDLNKQVFSGLVSGNLSIIED